MCRSVSLGRADKPSFGRVVPCAPAWRGTPNRACFAATASALARVGCRLTVLRRPAAAEGALALKAGVQSVDEGAVSRTLPARPDGVHDIAEPDASLRIREPHSAPGPEVAEAAEIRPEGSIRPSRLEAEAECGLSLEDRAPTLRLGRGRLG